MFSMEVGFDDLLDANSFVYFDWNVFSHLKGYLSKDKTFSIIIDFCNFTVPYSEAHLLDLYKSDVSYHDKDLNFLREVTKNSLIVFDRNLGFKIVKNKEIFSFYNDYKQYVIDNEREDISVLIHNYPALAVDESKLDVNHPMYELIKSQNYEMNAFVLQKFVEELARYHSEDDPKKYKKVRTYFREKILSMKNDSANEITSDFLDRYENYLNGFNVDSFKDCLNSFCKISNRNFHCLSLDEQFMIIDLILDFHPDFMDKMKKNNKLTNKENDNRHIYFGLNSKIFVSEDKLVRKKADFIFKFYEKSVSVIDFQTFITQVYEAGLNCGR